MAIVTPFNLTEPFSTDTFNSRIGAINTNILKSATKELYGLDEASGPDDAFAKLSGLYLHTWRKKSAVLSAKYGVAENKVVCYSYTGTERTFTYGNGFDMDIYGNVTLTETGTFTYSQTGSTVSNFNMLKGKYFYYHNQNGVTSGNLLYCVPNSPDATNDQQKWNLTCQTVIPYFEYGDEEYIASQDRNAYPDYSIVGGYEYKYEGVPFNNSVTASKIATNFYIGTGTYGSSNLNSLTFDFVPKIVFITSSYVGEYGQSEYMILFSSASAAARVESNYGSSYSGNSNMYAEFVTWNGNTVSWYNPSTTGHQMNESGRKYYYIAIG